MMRTHDKNKATGRLLVFLQFLLAAIVISAALIENSFMHRQEIAALKIASVVLLILSIVTVFTALFTFKQRVTPNPIPLQAAKLRTIGIYGLVRHPMYSSVIFLIAGFTLYERAYYSFFLNILVVVFLSIKIKFEEKLLSEKFQEYESYKNRTKKLIPFIY